MCPISKEDWLRSYEEKLWGRKQWKLWVLNIVNFLGYALFVYMLWRSYGR